MIYFIFSQYLPEREHTPPPYRGLDLHNRPSGVPNKLIKKTTPKGGLFYA